MAIPSTPCLLYTSSEGIHDKDGAFIAEYANKNMAKDSFGHAQLGGLAAFLANHVKQATGEMCIRDSTYSCPSSRH